MSRVRAERSGARRGATVSSAAGEAELEPALAATGAEASRGYGTDIPTYVHIHIYIYIDIHIKT